MFNHQTSRMVQQLSQRSQRVLPISRRLIIGCWLVLSGSWLVGQNSIKPQLLEITTDKRVYLGLPLKQEKEQVVMLRNNGRISTIPRSSIKTEKPVPGQFQPIDARVLRAELVKEFGNKYEVTMTRNFLVVHPPGEQQKWAAPFENLYGEFATVMRARGLALDKPQFPLVAVVLNTREEFDNFLKDQQRTNTAIEGYYSLLSNRVITYRPADEKRLDFYRMTTLVHEATHQVAYNTGIHSRTAVTPRWITEGLALLFEAPGYNRGRENGGKVAKINKPQLAIFKDMLEQGKLRGNLENLLIDDDWFEKDPYSAYAYAWALTYYLAENRPAQYTAYLRELGRRPDFEPYSATERKRDFQKHFGKNLSDLEQRLLKAVLE